MKLEVGMYIRTPNGIDKITSFIKECVTGYGFSTQAGCHLFWHKELDYFSIDGECFDKEEIEASHNIIDLIEVGDYVNGAKVNFVYRPGGKQVFRIELDVVGLKGHMICENKDIKSIVTKEQFESMSYKVDE
jgi:hypothetical protein